MRAFDEPWGSRPGNSRTPTEHLFSVDVEEYFQVNAFEGVVTRDRWEEYPSRIDESVGEILDLLAAAGATGTFFTLGWIAAKRPHLVKAIANAGHEVASHGFWHRRVPTLSFKEFRADLREAKAVLEDVSGTQVLGFRAPSFSILPGMEWAFDVLLEEGYRYDSSRFPIWRRGYGSPGTPRAPHWITCGSGRLFEVPMATAKIGGAVLPAAGGGYMRQLPFSLMERAFHQADAEGRSAMFYVHPWEIDPDQPRLPVSLLTRLRHYRGLSRTVPLLKKLLASFRFTSVMDHFPEIVQTPGAGSE